MTKKKAETLVDMMLGVAADAFRESVINHNMNMRGYAQGQYHAAKFLAEEYDIKCITGWPSFSEWAGYLAEAKVWL